MNFIDSKNIYRNILIVESRSSWEDFKTLFDSNNDIVLTFDFGLKKLIEKLGGKVFYVDSLCDCEDMHKNNILAEEFFKKWHYDQHGRDIFTAYGIPFGFAFRIEIWSEYLYYVRLRACIDELKKIKYERILLAQKNQLMKQVLYDAGLIFTSIDEKSPVIYPSYYFDIHKYMFDALHAKTFKNIIKKIGMYVFSKTRYFVDKFNFSNKKTIYAQIYHPTKPIIAKILNDSSIKIITSSLITGNGWRNFLSQRLIPIKSKNKYFDECAENLLKSFSEKRFAKLILNNGIDVTDGVYLIIQRQIRNQVSEALRILKSVIQYIESHPIHLQLMIANIGLLQTIVDCVLKVKKVPSYLIINGLMTSRFGDEAKYAKFINSYGVEAKKNYYQDATNVVALGDPRMDAYLNFLKGNTKCINRSEPIIGIGTSGFNSIDLNSYVAVEFEFMYDILASFKELKSEGCLFSLIIKVRPNGVLEQYRSFVEEYFPELDIQLIRDISIHEVLKNVDLYISIYSQTLFEASCMGIPTIYYKKDKEYLHPPFDGFSELVTANTVSELKLAFYDFKNFHPRYNSFLDKLVMEKYIGPLDGKNTERNLNFINNILSENINNNPK